MSFFRIVHCVPYQKLHLFLSVSSPDLLSFVRNKDSRINEESIEDGYQSILRSRTVYKILFVLGFLLYELTIHIIKVSTNRKSVSFNFSDPICY